MQPKPHCPRKKRPSVFHLLKWMNQKGLSIPLIIMTGYADIQSAVQAIKLGARDYVAKPVNPEELLKKITEALQTPSAPPAPAPTPGSNIRKGDTASAANKDQAYLEGESDAARQLYNYVDLVAPTNMSVLINGASGTGKEYVAHRIHQLSKRSNKPFIAIAATFGNLFIDDIASLNACLIFVCIKRFGSFHSL
ncbi:sigma 54-interacting transcriptional regulator [Streptococcus pneumoniae]|uniref:sigma 54-interacting transcriptional regulator n=1 Tax=Streptococcus pneumoniae TaxID=1313 RepID=UPI003F502F58